MARWNRKKYPENWEQISRDFRSSKDFTCEFCGYKQGEPLISKAGNRYRGTVDAAHKYPYDESNPEPALYCLCKRDHRIYDNSWQNDIDEVEHQSRMHQILIGNYGEERYWCEKCQDHYLEHTHDDDD